MDSLNLDKLYFSTTPQEAILIVKSNGDVYINKSLITKDNIKRIITFLNEYLSEVTPTV